MGKKYKTMNCPDCGTPLILKESAYLKKRRQQCLNPECPVIECMVSHYTWEAPKIYLVKREAVARAKPLNGLTIEYISKHPEVLDSE